MVALDVLLVLTYTDIISHYFAVATVPAIVVNSCYITIQVQAGPLCTQSVSEHLCTIHMQLAVKSCSVVVLLLISQWHQYMTHASSQAIGVPVCLPALYISCVRTATRQARPSQCVFSTDNGCCCKLLIVGQSVWRCDRLVPKIHHLICHPLQLLLQLLSLALQGGHLTLQELAR